MKASSKEAIKNTLDRYQKLKATRSNYEREWDELAMYCDPKLANFVTQNIAEGAPPAVRSVVDTPMQGANFFINVMETFLTPRHALWMQYEATGDEARLDPKLSSYLNQVRRAQFSMMNNQKTQAHSQISEVYRQLAVLGTGILQVSNGLNKGIIHKAIPLEECVIAENVNGVVDTLFRKYSITARQAVQKFGEANVGESIRKAYNNKKQDDKFDFMHAVRPYDDPDVDYGSYKEGIEYVSCEIAMKDRVECQKKGLRSFPYMVPRYSTKAGDVYGRSVAYTNLNAFRKMNATLYMILKQGEYAIDPMIMTTGDDVFGGALKRLYPGRVIRGALDTAGKPKAAPFLTGADLPFAMELLKYFDDSIRRGFFMNTFDINVEMPRQTATQVVSRNSEKMAMFGPGLGRIAQEFIVPMLLIQLEKMAELGKLPPPPPEFSKRFIEYLETEEFEVKFNSPISQLQKSDETAGITRVGEAAGLFAQFDPTALKKIDAAKAVSIIAANEGGMAIVKSDEQVAEEAQAEQAQQALMASVEAAPQLSQAALNTAKANQIGSGNVAPR